MRKNVFIITNFVLSFTVSLTAELALARDDRFRCRANGQGGREADLRLDGGEFRAKWEINLNQGQVPGDVVNVSIADVFIGGIVLELDGGQLEGEIRLSGNNLPDNFPQIQAGTPVTIGSLSCQFAKD